MLFSRRFSRTCLEGISFNFFVCFIFNVSIGSAPKRKNIDIQRNTRLGSGGQFTSNLLSCHHIRLNEKEENQNLQPHVLNRYITYAKEKHNQCHHLPSQHLRFICRTEKVKNWNWIITLKMQVFHLKMKMFGDTYILP